MPVQIDITYTGDLRCQAVHRPSQSTLTTDAPVDNGGKGELFSPTDLVAAALGTCLVTIMGKVAQRHGWDLNGTRVHVVKEMAAAPARRIGTLRTTITLPPGRKWLAEDRQRLEKAAQTCPVKESLHPDVQMPMEFVYPE
jgi:putative redox protein